MKKKGGLVDQIMKSARSDTRGPAGKVVRKKITLDTLQKVIEEYVHQTAGMGDPELRSKVVQLELQLGTVREQNTSIQKALESARKGWKAAQEELATAVKSGVGLQEDVGEDLSKAKSEALQAYEEISKLKGKVAAAEMRAGEADTKVSEAKEKTGDLARRLDDSKRNEKKLRSEVKTLTAEAKARAEKHRLEVEALESRVELLAAGFDHMELLPALDWDELIERSKSASARAGDLSVGAESSARATLEGVSTRCDEIRLELEAGRDEQTAKIHDMEAGRADFSMVARIMEIQHRVAAQEAELAFLEVISESFGAPEEQA
ncbi:MAG: hypothetical protein ACYTFG_17815 [Planctomycetota bacterium]|jgi:chromosome segregation ATPase